MKKIFLVLFATGLFACQNADQKSAEEANPAGSNKAVSDPAGTTTIEWIDSTVQDLGKIKSGQVVEVSYRFRNSGQKNLVITNVSASCGCTVPEKPEKPIAPGEESIIRAKFDSNGRPAGETRKDVTVYANTSPESTTLSFRVEIMD